MKNEEIDMAYTAGILDGDGSFSLLLHRSVTKDSWRSFYHPCIQLSNAFEGMSKWMNEKFGGSLRIKKPQQPHHKTLHVWSIRSREGCKRLVEKIIPYLKLKTEQAKTMLDFLKIDHFDMALGEKFNLKMKDLNRRALFDPTGYNRQTLVDSNDPLFWSYAAGIMDTEGSFSIRKEHPHSGSISIRYNSMIQLTMVSCACLNFIRSNCSVGTFCVPKAKTVGKGYAYKMNIGKKSECVSFSNNILPYLKCKKQQASLMIKFCEENVAVKNCRAGVPEETLKFREECYQQMRLLNK